MGEASCSNNMETGKSGHEMAFQGIAKIGIMVVSAGRFLHRRIDTIQTIYSPCFSTQVTVRGPRFQLF